MTAHSSEANHEVLLTVAAQVKNVSETLEKFITTTGEENLRIHNRITDEGNKFDGAINSIKDALALRGRISGQFILSMIAVVLTAFTITGGFVHFYVSSQINPMQIEELRSSQEIGLLRSQREALELSTIKIANEESVARTRIEKDIEWMLKTNPPVTPKP
jgi:hypothetical protein